MAEGISQAEQSIIFISYRRADSGWAADLLASWLQRTLGVPRMFCDIRGIDAGDDFAADLEEQLQRALVILVLIGGDWLRVQDQYGRRPAGSRQRLGAPGDSRRSRTPPAASSSL